MKFLCDRCKTRYSIGDDRVRGKILKIRCKNCANVITVREGMTDGSEAEVKRGRPTTGAPPGASGSALGAAFAQQLAKPPPALEEEWYVSIDGEQSGPFSLGEAQRWISAKPFDAELHCWSEGFDDWLPVDKVSHFRGLRQRPKAPTAPPPLPRAVRSPVAAARAPAAVEDEPKPLFAATMAALERDSEKIKMPPQLAATPAPATAPRVNGGAGQAVAMPAQIKPLPSLAKAPATPAAHAKLPAPAKPVAARANGGSAGAKALAEAFDISAQQHADPAESLTAVDSPAFDDDLATTAEPVASKRTPTSLDAVAPPRAAASAPMAAAAPIRPVFEPEPSDGDEDDGLSIGEVSRVVKLADLAKMGRSSGASPAVAQRSTGAQPRLNRTGAVARMPAADVVPGGTGPFEPIAPGAVGLMPGMPGAPLASESVVAAAPYRAHRRGLILMLSAAGLLLAAVVIGVVLFVQSTGNDEPSSLGRQQEFDTSRPDDPRPRNALEAVASTGAMGSAAVPIRTYRRPQPQQIVQKQPELPEVPGRLKADEIEDMAAKQGEGTKRCYMRAQKGALGLDIGDLRKIDVTLVVDKDGTVSDVQLSDHAGDNFGKCLIGRIRGWKFRTSPGGTFKIALAFSNG